MPKRVYKKMKKNRSSIDEGRLENLPESMQFHILTFLDTKRAVQVSAFSKQWLSLWTSKPVLRLNSFDFRDLRDFDTFVDHVLSRRDHSAELNTLAFIRSGVCGPTILTQVLDYAFSNGVNHLEVSIALFRELSWPVSLYTVSDSLKTLKLESDHGYISCPFLRSGSFKNLTVLYLKKAIICNSHEAFLGFSMLEKLVLEDCYVGSVLRVQSPKLSDLAISCNGYFNQCELTTPNLRFFKCIGNVFPELQTHGRGGLPVLETVVIGFFRDDINYYEKETTVDDLISLFRGLGNARSLTLSSSIFGLLRLFQGILKELDSPFRNLECLNMDVRYVEQDDDVSERLWLEDVDHDDNLFGRLSSIGVEQDDNLFEKQYADVKAYLLKRSPDAKFSIIRDDPAN